MLGIYVKSELEAWKNWTPACAPSVLNVTPSRWLSDSHRRRAGGLMEVPSVPSELEMLQRKGQLHADSLCLAVADPSPELGSGGVTLNALLVAAEHLSAAAGHTAVSTPPVIVFSYYIQSFYSSYSPPCGHTSFCP